MLNPARLLRPLILLLIFTSLVAGLGLDPIHPVRTVHAQVIPTGITLTAQAGFGGNFKPNTWIPVFVQIENTSANPSSGFIQIQFIDAGTANVYQYPIDLPAGARKELSLLSYAPSYGYELEVAYYIKQATGILERRAFLVVSASNRSADDLLIGVLASTPSAFNPLNLLKPLNGDTIMIDLNLQDLPEDSQGLASLGMLVFADFDTSALTARQSAALSNWVRGGGRLVVCGGAGWQKTSAGLAGLLPLQPDSLQSNTNWQELITLAGNDPENITTPAEIEILSGSAMIAAVTNLTAVQTSSDILPASWTPKVLAWAGDLPLAVHQQVGHGEVVFISFDPQKPPFRNWDGMDSLYRSWFGSTLNPPIWSKGFSDWYNATYAAETLPNLTVPSIFLICGFLFFYMLLLGPVNFLILRKLKRPELAWVTIPAMVILFSLIILISGGLTRSRLPILNRLAVVQVWPGENKSARFDGVIGIYSPFRSAYTVDFGSTGLPHLIPDNPTASTNRQEFQLAGSGYQAINFMVDVNAINSIAIEGSLPAPAISPKLSIQIGELETRLTGSITNLTDFDLINAALITPGGAVTLGDLKAGETIALNESVPANPVSLDPNIPQLPLLPLGSKPGPLLPTAGTPGQIEAMMGTADFFSDRATYRRYTLLMAAVQNSYYAISGSGYYLTGWSTKPVLPATLSGEKTENQDTTFYIIQVQPDTQISPGLISIPPGLFSVKTIDATGLYPYSQGYYLYGGEFITLEFSLNPAIPFKSVQGLTLNLDSPEYILTPVENMVFRLWDFKESEWVELPDLIWSANQIGAPDRFVAADGTIRLRLENSDQNYISINSISVNMVIEK